MSTAQLAFIRKATQVHGTTYSYDKVSYVNTHTPVTITCPVHGDFSQRPVKHTSQRCGCPRCSLTATTEDFITKSILVHHDKYDYSESVFVTSRTHTTVICHNHGPFSITPNNHMQGWGCPTCGGHGLGGYNPSTLSGTELGASPGLLYVVQITTTDGDSFHKIGITKQQITKRLQSPTRSVDIIASVPGTMYGVFMLEQQLIHKFKEFKYVPQSMIGNGSTECFVFDSTTLSCVVESISLCTSVWQTNQERTED